MPPKAPERRTRTPDEVRAEVGVSIRAMSRLSRLTERLIVAYESGEHDGSGLSSGQIAHLDRVYAALAHVLEVAS